jgi:MFS family permease
MDKENKETSSDGMRTAHPEKQRASLGEIFTRDFLIISTINLCMFFGFQMLNVGLPMYMAQLGAVGQVVGLATTLMTVTATLVRVFAGALLDRFGRWGLLIEGSIVMVLSIVSFAIFPIVGVILGMRLLHGIGWGTSSTAASTIAADIIPKRRFAEGMGYFALTNAISSAIAPVAAVELIQGVSGSAMVYVAAGITVLALILAVIEALITKKKDARSAASKDEAVVPGKPVNQGAAEGSEMPAPPQSKLDTLFERRAVVPGILMLLVNIGFGCITTFIALHADAQQVSGVSAYFVVYAIVTLASRPYIGKLIDRHGYRIPAMLATLCMAGTLVFIGLSNSTFMFAMAGVLGGLGIGTSMGTFQAMAVANVEPWRRGVATSTYMTAFDLGIAIGAFAGGFIVDIHGYTVMYFTVAVFPLVACALSAALIKKGEGAQQAR